MLDSVRTFCQRTGLTLLIGLLLSVSIQAETLKFSAIPDEDETRLRERFDKMAVYLSEHLQVPVEFVPVKSYAATITAFRNNQIQLGWFGGLSGVRARLAVENSSAIAQGDEDRYFKTYIIANHSVAIEPGQHFPKAISGKSFTFGSKGSTSGRLMPEYHIRQQLGAPDSIFSRVGFSGNHSKTIALVQAGAYEVGAVNYKVWENELKAGNIDPKQIKILWQTPPYPDYHWVVRGDVDQKWGPGFQKKIKKALLDLDDKSLLASFPRKRFVPTDASNYQPIEDVARSIGLLDN